MKALLTLARFVSPSEQQEIVSKIASMEYEVKPDSLAPQRRLIVNGPVGGKLFEVEGVSQVIVLHADKRTKTLGEAAKVVAETAKKLNLDAFTVRLKRLGDVPFHEKALKERVRKKCKHIAGRTLYVEAKKTRDDVIIRVGLPETFFTEAKKDFVLVLESPKTPHEVADFLRLAIVFDLPLRISLEGDLRTLQALQEAKKIVKGHEKTKVMTYKTTLQAIRGRKAVAFSLWGDKSEEWLKKSPEINALVFGNEERGLKLSSQKECVGVVHLGPKSSEPMRATQAAAYALGVMA